MAIAVVYIAIQEPQLHQTPHPSSASLSQTAAYRCRGEHRQLYRVTGTDLSTRPCRGHHRLYLCISAANAANMANKMWPQISTLPIPVVIVLAMLIGAAIGCFNGFS